MIQLLVIVFILVGISVLLLGINIFIFGRKFPETEVGRNKHMIRLGLRCPKCEESINYKRKIRPADINPTRLRPDWSHVAK